jgi:DNA-binding transcriptional LysR family regulator
MIENFRIRVFRAVAQHLNFSRAAEELLLTQPAITQQIKALKDEFGIPLFDRGGGHIALTAGGKALMPFAERMKELSDEAFAAVVEAICNMQANSLWEPPRPSVNISCQPS